MYKKRLSATIGMIIMAASLAGCGNAASQTTVVPDKDVTQATTTEAKTQPATTAEATENATTEESTTVAAEAAVQSEEATQPDEGDRPVAEEAGQGTVGEAVEVVSEAAMEAVTEAPIEALASAKTTEDDATTSGTSDTGSSDTPSDGSSKKIAYTSGSGNLVTYEDGSVYDKERDMNFNSMSEYGKYINNLPGKQYSYYPDGSVKSITYVYKETGKPTGDVEYYEQGELRIDQKK